MTHSRTWFDLVSTRYPCLNDVWTTHLVPFIVCSNEEMNRKRFLIYFTLHRIFVRRRAALLPTNSIWRTSRTWYIQPGIIVHRSLFVNWRTMEGRHFHICFLLENALHCCSLILIEHQYRRDPTFSRTLHDNLQQLTLWESDGEIWRHYHDGYQEEHAEEGFEIELPQEELSSFCPHLQRCLLMHAVRHRVRTLRHVE